MNADALPPDAVADTIPLALCRAALLEVLREDVS